MRFFYTKIDYFFVLENVPKKLNFIQLQYVKQQTTKTKQYNYLN